MCNLCDKYIGVGSILIALEAQRRAVAHIIPRILLVEDDKLQRKLLSQLLSDRGYDVEAVATAAAAIAAMSHSFDLMITDVDLGSPITGLDLARLARSMRGDIPVVILSARDPAASEGAAIVHLRKPCTSGVILNTVQALAPLPDTTLSTH